MKTHYFENYLYKIHIRNHTYSLYNTNIYDNKISEIIVNYTSIIIKGRSLDLLIIIHPRIRR
jgi:hypothetical protein